MELIIELDSLVKLGVSRKDIVDEEELVRCGGCWKCTHNKEDDTYYCEDPKGMSGFVSPMGYCSKGGKK